MKFVRNERYVSKEKATKHVIHLAKSLNIDTPKYKNFGENIILKNEYKEFRVNFRDEVQHTIEFGKANMLQAWFDAEDRFLQPALEMSVSGAVPGITFNLITSSIGEHTVSVTNHGALEAPELALARDICYFHKETCEKYNVWNIEGFSRCFRGFLHSCVSLVDCFLYRYAFHIRDIIPDPSHYINTLTLDSRSSVMERLEAWITTFATKEIDAFKGWSERSQFIELKNKRNEFTHPSVPTVTFEPKDVAKYLNYGATGVGKLLGKMRRCSSATDRIGFIHQVSHLPKVIARNEK